MIRFMVLVLLNWKVCGELCRKLIPTRMRVSDYKKKCKSCFRKEFQQGREQMKEPFGAQQNPAVPKTYHIVMKRLATNEAFTCRGHTIGTRWFTAPTRSQVSVGSRPADVADALNELEGQQLAAPCAATSRKELSMLSEYCYVSCERANWHPLREHVHC